MFCHRCWPVRSSIDCICLGLPVYTLECLFATDAWTLLLNQAFREGIRRLANAYRNAPIQGGVADIMLDAYGQLYEKLQIFDRAVGVQTVHDSVVIECSRSESVQIGQLVKSTLEKSMARWCPDVTPLADTDIRVSLSEKDIISEIVS